MDKIKAIRSEIERKLEEALFRYHPYASPSVVNAYKNLLSFIDTLPEEPKTLEEEITYFNEWMKHNGLVLNTAAIAHYFAKWGAEHLNEM